MSVEDTLDLLINVVKLKLYCPTCTRQDSDFCGTCDFNDYPYMDDEKRFTHYHKSEDIHDIKNMRPL